MKIIKIFGYFLPWLFSVWLFHIATTAKKDNNDDDCDVVLEIYTISQPNWCWLALVGGCGGHIPDYHHDNIESYAAIPTTEAAANYGEYLFISIMWGYAIIILIIILDHFISLLNVFLSFFQMTYGNDEKLIKWH